MVVLIKKEATLTDYFTYYSKLMPTIKKIFYIQMENLNFTM